MAAVGKRERDIYYFAERVRTKYTSLMCTQKSIFCDSPKAVLGDEQSCEDYLSGYQAHFGEDTHSLLLVDADIDEEHSGNTLPAEDDSDVLNIPPSPGALGFFWIFPYFWLSFK